MKISELDSFKKKNPNLQQIPTAPSFRLKGTGWYETDFKTGNKKNVVKSDKETSTEKKDNNKNTKNENKKDEKKNNSKG